MRYPAQAGSRLKGKLEGQRADEGLEVGHRNTERLKGGES